MYWRAPYCVVGSGKGKIFKEDIAFLSCAATRFWIWICCLLADFYKMGVCVSSLLMECPGGTFIRLLFLIRLLFFIGVMRLCAFSRVKYYLSQSTIRVMVEASVVLGYLYA